MHGMKELISQKKLNVVTWMDGGKSQLVSTLKESMMMAMDAMKIVVNKYSAARICIEQTCDLSLVFCSFTSLSLSVTCNSMPVLD